MNFKHQMISNNSTFRQIFWSPNDLPPAQFAQAGKIRHDQFLSVEFERPQTTMSCDLVDARNLNEAIQIASKFPAARLGSMEVRSVLEPDSKLTSALDQKIGTAICHNVAGKKLTGPARMASLPQDARQPTH